MNDPDRPAPSLAHAIIGLILVIGVVPLLFALASSFSSGPPDGLLRVFAVWPLILLLICLIAIGRGAMRMMSVVENADIDAVPMVDDVHHESSVGGLDHERG